MKKVVSIVLVAVMLCGVFCSADLSAFATSVEISNRAQWLSKLADVFDMQVESEKYPANYFSDLDSNSPYYYDVLLATEFGLIEVEAGGEVNPEGAITREFAAQTLNQCLGFTLDDGEGASVSNDTYNYTFTDWQSCAFPYHDQVALNRGWFALESGNTFAPEKVVTVAEIQVMLEDAEKTLEGDKVEENYNSSYAFSESTKQIASSTAVDFYENYIVLHDTDCDIGSGDNFVVQSGDIPVLYKAESVSSENGVTTVYVSDDVDESAVVYADIQAVVPADTSRFIPAEGYEIVSGRKRSAENGTVQVTRDSIELMRVVTLPDETEITIHVALSDLVFSTVFNTIDGNYSAQVSCKADVGFSFDAESDFAINNHSWSHDFFNFGRFFFAGIGYVELKPDVEVSGSMEYTQTFDIVAGASVDADGMRIIQSFHRGTFHALFELEGHIGLKVELGVRVLTQKMNLYAKVGAAARAALEVNTDPNGNALNCVTISIYLFFDVGAEIQVALANWRTYYDLNVPIYTETNSPLRLYYHYENGIRVSKCTAGDGYFSPDDDAPAHVPYGNGTCQLYYSCQYDSFNNPDYAIVSGHTGIPTNVVIPSTYILPHVCYDSYYDEINNKWVYLYRTEVFPVKRINYRAFNKCSSLERITIPNCVISIGYEAFQGCSNLKSVTIGNSVTSIGNSAFSGCRSLKSITIPSSVTSISDYAFSSCSSLENITIPNSVTSIGEGTFDGCSSLKNITLPNSVTSIGGNAFGSCSSLKNITLPNSVISIGDGIFFNCNSLKNATISNSIKSISDYAFHGCSGLESVTIPNSVTIIGNFAFCYCSSLESVAIPSSVTNIGSVAFSNCSSLKSVTIPNSVISIGINAFSGCSYLESVTMETGVTNIESAAFYNCNSLESVTIPNSVTSISNHAFFGCSSLKDVYFNGSEEEWNEISISDYNTDLTNATIHFKEDSPHQHCYTAVVTAPTCTKQGYTTRTCECGDVQVGTFVPAFGHAFEVNEQYCLNGCGALNPDYKAPEPVHVHAYTKTVVTPKTSAVGYTLHWCTCGDSFKSDFKAPTGKPAGFKCAARTAAAEKFTWTKTTGASGYQIQLLNAAGKSVGTAVTTGTGYTFSKLAAGHAYKARVRFYIKAADGKNYFSSWSATLNSPTLTKGTNLALTAAKKSFTAKWTKVAGVTGYQIQYATNAKFTGAKTVNLKGASKYIQAVKNLKGGAKYYVRIRTYKTIGGVNYFSAWSAAKAVTTKK